MPFRFNPFTDRLDLTDVSSSPSGNLSFLTGNTGGPVPGDASQNINILGSGSIIVSGNPGTSTLTISQGSALFPVTPYVVGPIGFAGYQTIQSAVNAANAAGGGIVVVQPGTYTENLTLFSNVHIMGLQFADAGGGVNIVGTHIPPISGGFTFQYVALSSSTAIFNSVAAGTTHLILANAAINITNGYTFNLPNWTGKLESFDVNAAIGTADGYINNSGGSTIAIFECSIGSGTTNVMTISGPYFVDGIAIYCPVNFITGSSLFSDFSTYNQQVTLSNNTTGYLRNCTFTGGANPAITMSSSAAIEISHAVVSSSNNPAISGSTPSGGTLTLTDVSFISNALISGSITVQTTPSFFPANYTAHGVLLGEGAACLNVTAAGTNGQVLIGSTGADPAFGTITSPNSTITFTTGANSLAMDVNSSIITQAQVTLTSTQIKNLRATPQIIVPAPGAGNTVNVLGMQAKYVYGGTSAFTNAQNLGLFPQGSGSSHLVSGPLTGSTLLTPTVNTYQTALPQVTTTLTASAFEYTALVLGNLGLSEITGNAANDNTLVVTVIYQILTQ